MTSTVWGILQRLMTVHEYNLDFFTLRLYALVTCYRRYSWWFGMKSLGNLEGHNCHCTTIDKHSPSDRCFYLALVVDSSHTVPERNDQSSIHPVWPVQPLQTSIVIRTEGSCQEELSPTRHFKYWQSRHLIRSRLFHHSCILMIKIWTNILSLYKKSRGRKLRSTRNLFTMWPTAWSSTSSRSTTHTEMTPAEIFDYNYTVCACPTVDSNVKSATIRNRQSIPYFFTNKIVERRVEWITLVFHAVCVNIITHNIIRFSDHSFWSHTRVHI